MATILTKEAAEKSSYIIRVQPTDEAGNSVIPASVTWSLVNASGQIINSREDVVVSSPAATMYIALSGNDLALESQDSSYETRWVVVEGTYESYYTSEALPLHGSCRFNVVNLRNIT